MGDKVYYRLTLGTHDSTKRNQTNLMIQPRVVGDPMFAPGSWEVCLIAKR